MSFCACFAEELKSENGITAAVAAVDVAIASG
jgi:hypothetical protein